METRWLPASILGWTTALARALDARQQVRFVTLCGGLLFVSAGCFGWILGLRKRTQQAQEVASAQ